MLKVKEIVGKTWLTGTTMPHCDHKNRRESESQMAVTELEAKLIFDGQKQGEGVISSFLSN